jgi:hydroxyacylglutathione hydrolase
VDAGIGLDVDSLLANVEAAGVAPESVGHVLLTHAHPDHSGGAATLRRRLRGARARASAEVARWVEEGDERAMSLGRGQRAELYPVGYRFAPCSEVEPMNDGDCLRVGAVELEAVATPGHAAGHLAFLARGGAVTACFGGDLVFFGGQISLESNWDCSLPDYAASVRRLAGREFEAFLPGHGQLSLRRGRRHAEAAARQFERGLVPRSVV